MNISLTDKIEKWIEKRVKKGGYTGASEVIREAIREKMDHEENEEKQRQGLDEAIGAGLEQAKRGEFVEPYKVWEQMKQRQEAARRKKKAA